MSRSDTVGVFYAITKELPHRRDIPVTIRIRSSRLILRNISAKPSKCGQRSLKTLLLGFMPQILVLSPEKTALRLGDLEFHQKTIDCVLAHAIVLSISRLRVVDPFQHRAEMIDMMRHVAMPFTTLEHHEEIAERIIELGLDRHGDCPLCSVSFGDTQTLADR